MIFKRRTTRNIIIRPLTLALFCFFLYPPKLISVPFLIPAIVYGVSIVYILLNWKLILEACFRQRKIIFLVLLLFVISLIIPIINATDDFSYAFSAASYFLKKGIVYLFLLSFILKKYGKEKLLYHFMYYFIVTHVIYVIGTLILVFSPSIQNFWFGIFNKESADVLLRSSGYTFRLGWQGFAGFTLTLNCTLSIIFLLFLKFETRPRMITMSQFLIPFIACMIGNMFYGRIGLIISIIVSSIAMIFWNRKHLEKIVLSVAFILLFILAIGTLKDVPFFSGWYNWMSRPIINLIDSGEFNDKSFDRLQEMNQVEISPNTFVFGDGLYKDDEGRSYMDTDAGFIRNILFWGIFGAILSYGLTLYSIFELRKISRMLVLQLLITFFAFEYKGVVYYEFIVIDFIVMAAFYIANNGRIDNKKVDDGIANAKQLKNGGATR